MEFIKRYGLLIIIILALIFIVFQKEEPQIITKIKVETIRDTIKEIEISPPKIVYYETIKTIKGKDSIIYKNTPTSSTNNANLYTTKLKSNNAEADLKILSLGPILDVSGVITYPERIKTITTIKAKSGLYLYGSFDIARIPTNYELGLLYQFKNKILVGVGANFNTIINKSSLNIKVGIKL